MRCIWPSPLRAAYRRHRPKSPPTLPHVGPCRDVQLFARKPPEQRPFRVLLRAPRGSFRLSHPWLSLCLGAREVPKHCGQPHFESIAILLVPPLGHGQIPQGCHGLSGCRLQAETRGKPTNGAASRHTTADGLYARTQYGRRKWNLAVTPVDSGSRIRIWIWFTGLAIDFHR